MYIEKNIVYTVCRPFFFKHGLYLNSLLLVFGMWDVAVPISQNASFCPSSFYKCKIQSPPPNPPPQTYFLRRWAIETPCVWPPVHRVTSALLP